MERLMNAPSIRQMPTPSVALGSEITKRVEDLMMAFGIRKLTMLPKGMAHAYTLGASCEAFDSLPDDMAHIPALAKDALAQLLALTGATYIELKPSRDERNKLDDMWEQACRLSNSARLANTGGSAEPANPGMPASPEPPADADDQKSKSSSPREDVAAQKANAEAPAKEKADSKEA